MSLKEKRFENFYCWYAGDGDSPEPGDLSPCAPWRGYVLDRGIREGEMEEWIRREIEAKEVVS